MSWEDTFRSWGAAPGTTEQEKMEHAETAIRKAIDASPTLSGMDITIIPQGSYRARTNVRQDSDVDICICLNSTFFAKYPPGKTGQDYGNTSGSISFSDFRHYVRDALENYFDYGDVDLGNKAFDVNSNSYRVDADVVPAFAYRDYSSNTSDLFIKPTGIAFVTSNGKLVINWPYQSYKNGKEKHDRTSQRFRKMVRIVKRLRNTMQENGIAAANEIGSFFIESLVWNVTDDGFNHDDYVDDVRYVLAHCFNETLTNGSHLTLREINNHKLLFGAHQSCTRERANDFFRAAWDYVGFE